MRKESTRLIVALFCLFFGLALITIISCGGGGDESSSPSWTGPVNAAGFPDVEGKYSFNTGPISYTCTDGTNGTLSAIAMNFELSQNANQLFFYNPAASSIPGITIIARGTGTANIDKTGYFIGNQRIIATISPAPGTNTIDYNLSGHFSMTGWSGNYQYVMYNDYYKVSCTCNTTFTGDYISPLAEAQAKINPYEEVEQAVEKIPLEGNLNDMKFLFGLP
jgi:hypothetical protein